MTSAAAPIPPEMWSQPAYVERQIALIEEALTGVLFGDYSVSVQTEPGAPIWGNLAMHINVVINAARNAIARAEHERRRVEALYELTRALVSASDGDEVPRLAVETVRRLLGLDVVGLRLVDGGDLVLRAATGVWTSARSRLKVGESLSGRVVAANAPVVSEDVRADERFDAEHRQAAASTGLLSFLGVPIKQPEGPALGVLYGFSAHRRGFAADEVALLSAFADQISVSLDKERLAAERRRAEETARQSEKLATMGRLLASVAHELNNPLSVVVGFAELVRARLTDPALRSAVEEIETAGHRCTRIVRNFLALARQHPPERGAVDVNALVSESVELVAYALRVDGVEVRLDLADPLPPLWADRHQLQQVLVNLVTNAHHAMRDAAVRRLALTTRHDAGHARVVLRVADSGPGVPEALRDRIFEPFFTTKPMGQGTGLGLSLCQGIVEAHGGTLTLERTADHGAVFRIELPTTTPVSAAGEPSGQTIAPPGGGASVLVVDDEPAIAGMLAAMLTADGYQAETATSGATALDTLRARTYDVVVTDVRMPGIDGPRLYADAAGVSRGRTPAFVFMTGDLLGQGAAAVAERLGVPCLRKPFVLDEVRHVMAEVRRPAAS